MKQAPQQSDRPGPNCYWVQPDRLLAGEYPARPRDAAGSRDRIARLLEAGITAFIDLTEPHELPPYEQTLRAEAAGRGMSVVYRRMSIKDMSVPKSAGAMAEILDAIDQLLAAGHSIYVHCWGGVGRTGTVVGCYLVRRGLTGQQSLQRITQLWQYMEEQKRARHPRSPETAEQENFVRNWSESDGVI